MFASATASLSTAFAPRRAFLLAAALTFAVVIGSRPAHGEMDDASAAKLGPADTSSPRATLMSFIETCNDLHAIIEREHFFDRTSTEHRPIAVRIFDCLDVSQVADFERVEFAGQVSVCLKEIIDRVELPPLEEIPNLEMIEAAGGVEQFPRWRIPGTRITIVRIEEGPQRHEYLFSAGTVGRAISYYEDVKSLPYRSGGGPPVSPGFYQWYMSSPGHPWVAPIVDQLPDWTRQRRFGVAIWKGIGLLIFLAIALCVIFFAYRLQKRESDRYRDTRIVLYCATIIYPVIAMCAPLLFKHFTYHYLTLRGQPLYITSFFANVTFIFAAIVVVFGISSRIAAIIIASPNIRPEGLNAQLIRIVSKLFSLVASVILFLEGGRYLGFPLTTLLASAGVGGLALALAAQDTLKTLFGTIMLMADKPFRVGERIVFDQYDGVVEDIGLRSTRIRLLTGHQVTIPNDDLARKDIENVARRPHIRRVANLHVPLDTPRELLEKAVQIVRTALEDHEGMPPDFPPRVFFNEFNQDSFNVRIIYWYSPPNYWDFLAFSEKLNLDICRAFEEHGVQFSLPARISHTSIVSEEKPIEVKMIQP